MTTSAPTPAPAALFFGPYLSDQVKTFLKAQHSPHTRRSYARAINNLDVYAEGRPVTRELILDWRADMKRRSSPATVNSRLTAIRQFFDELRRVKRITADEAAELLDVHNVPQRGVRTGTWLTARECKQLLEVPDRTTLRGKRNFCILAVLLGCALRRSELADLDVDTIARSDDRWIFENLRGKGGRVRTIAIPGWVKDAIAAWMFAAKIDRGKVIRPLDGDPAGLSGDAIWEIVGDAAREIGIENFTPHDIRRTCAKLARKNGGELEQIQFLLGHSSLVTTERYLGSTQNLKTAVNDSLGF